MSSVRKCRGDFVGALDFSKKVLPDFEHKHRESVCEGIFRI